MATGSERSIDLRGSFVGAPLKPAAGKIIFFVLAWIGGIFPTHLSQGDVRHVSVIEATFGRSEFD